MRPATIITDDDRRDVGSSTCRRLGCAIGFDPVPSRALGDARIRRADIVVVLAPPEATAAISTISLDSAKFAASAVKDARPR